MKTPITAGSCYDYANDYWLKINDDFPDITAAFYNGNFSKTLRQAQRDKHKWVLSGIEFKPGDRVLDIGCGWGPMLAVIREQSGRGVGFTISDLQVQYCRNRGLEVYSEDWKDADVIQYGQFDGIVSIGAFEHFCSPEEFKKGIQERIYKQFFSFCHHVLKEGRKLFLQTMTWGYKVPELDEINPDAPHDLYHHRIRGAILGLSSWWPPSSEEQIVEIAAPYFDYIESNSGREDYAQTFFEWHKRWREVPLMERWMIDVKTYLKYFASPGFIKIMKNYKKTRADELFREAFVQKVLNHSRIFFKKKPLNIINDNYIHPK
jgi:cyclopropane-fatty-acyl-phospholipid synthase